MTYLDIFEGARVGIFRAHMWGLCPVEVLLGPEEWEAFNDPDPTFMTATQVLSTCLKGECEVMGLPVKRMRAEGVAVRAKRTVIMGS
jgi:hypothetical protein